MGLREWRRQKNKSITVMAKELGVGTTSIKNWSNYKAISYKCRERFIEVYGIDPLDLGLPLEQRGRMPDVVFRGELTRKLYLK